MKRTTISLPDDLALAVLHEARRRISASQAPLRRARAQRRAERRPRCGQYADFPLGSTDASVIALAERLGTDVVITLDRWHFGAVRPRHCEALRLLPD
jgi:predicted nucleic acid-binding protein